MENDYLPSPGVVLKTNYMSWKSTTLLGLLLLFAWSPLFAQPGNDDCIDAITLTDVDNWCSEGGAYTNVNATLNNSPDPFCFPGINNDVWFEFVAIGTDVSIEIYGNIDTSGTLNNPQFALYSGDCNNLVEIACASDAFNTNLAASYAGPLVPGQVYYIQVDSRTGDQGTFQLCIDNFSQVPEPSADCITGVVLCDKSPFSVTEILSAGSVLDEIGDVSCNVYDPISPCILEEFQVSWYKWTCDQSGSLTFDLTPLNPSDDLDFVVYELPNGIDDCSGKFDIRCMASGEVVMAPFDVWEPCTGVTGLSIGDGDTGEPCGCDPGDNNYAEAINMVSGTSYALVIMNFTQSGDGFSIEFGGTGTFLSSKVDFIIDPELGNECDLDEVSFINNSELLPGVTANYEWFFGDAAVPPSADGEGPHEVIYGSVGTKSIILRLETTDGCIVSLEKEIEIEPCCDPDTDIEISLEELFDPICFGDSTGVINVDGDGGTPFYSYSLDGINFQPSGDFGMVTAGSYQVYIQDIKGCIDSLPVSLFDPPQIVVDAGPDQIVELGQTTSHDGTLISAPPGDIIYAWTPPETLLDPANILDPGVFPVLPTVYYLTATSDLGCIGQDSVFIDINVVRPIYVPNAFSPNFDGVNDYFTLFGGPAASNIEVLRVFDRWGALLYEGFDLPLNVENVGWDGTFRGEPMGTGVFAFYAEVGFIDGVSILYEGDITLIR